MASAVQSVVSSAAQQNQLTVCSTLLRYRITTIVVYIKEQCEVTQEYVCTNITNSLAHVPYSHVIPELST
jgi:hypothetical protein